MFKNLLSLILVCAVGSLSAQYVYVNAPEDCEGALRFNITNAWGALLTDDIWTADVAIVDDATALPTEGCNTLVNPADISGNIAFVDRGSCNFSLKALNAQMAGAVGVIIANNIPGGATLQMGAGNFATEVTIPVVMVSYEDGQILRSKIAEGLNMTLGNLKFDNDIGVSIATVIAPQYSTVPAHQIEDMGNITFAPGGLVDNHGTVGASNPTVAARINHIDGSGNSTLVYEETGVLDPVIGQMAVIAPDSASLIRLPDFDLGGYADGRFEYSYDITSDSMDIVNFDNTFSEEITITNSIMCKARWDAANNRPQRTNGFTIAGGGNIEMLTPFEIPNGTNRRIDSVTFEVSTALPTLANIGITVFVYKWEDENEDGNFAASEVEIVAFGFQEFDAGETEPNAWVTLEIEDFETGDIGYVLQGDDQRIIIGTRYEGNDQVFFGFDEGVVMDAYINDVLTPEGNYNDAQLPYGQSTSFGAAGADFDAIGLFTDTWFVSATAIHIADLRVSTDDLSADEATIDVFPNPTTDFITATVELHNTANERIVYQIFDQQGRLMHQSRVTGISKDTKKFDVNNYVSGAYQLVITGDDGQRSLPFVVK